MTSEEAIGWAMKYMSRNARKNHVDYDEHMRRTKYMVNKLYADFEQQNKALTDMVEILTEKIKRLEEPKSCEVCKYFNILTQDGVLSCGVFGDIRSEVGFEYNFSCNKYAPKETK